MKNIIMVLFFSFLLLQGCDSKQTSQEVDKNADETVTEVDSTAVDSAEVMVEETMPETTAPDAMAVEETIVEEVATTEPQESASENSLSTESVSGEQIYKKSCASCHASGAAGAPKLGDVAAWKPRIAKGLDALYTSAKVGIPGTAMMAKGTCAACSDEELNAAVDYMVEKSK